MIGHKAIPLGKIGRSVNGLFLDHVDRNFGTIGLREPRFVFQPRRHCAIADLMRVAERIELEQFGSKRFAAGVPLAFVLIDANSQFSRHSDSSRRLRLSIGALVVLFEQIIAGCEPFTSV
jgi:hypothetical protein